MFTENTDDPTDDPFAEVSDDPICAPDPAEDWVPAADAIPSPEKFCINSERRANWFLRRMANIAAERERLIKQHAAMLAELDRDSLTLDFLFGGQLEAWTAQEIKRRGKRGKTLNLPQGKCASRTLPASVVLLPGSDADPELLEHAKEAGYMRVVPEVPAVPAREEFDAAAFLKAATDTMKETGELPKWCDRIPERESFSYPGKPDPKKIKATPTEGDTPE